jgi:hypothetical protein
MSDETQAKPQTPQSTPSVEQQPEVCLGPDCVQVLFRPGIGLEVIVKNSCSIGLKEKAKQAAQELLDGKIKMRYTVED